jgi:hypothetical protein
VEKFAAQSEKAGLRHTNAIHAPAGGDEVLLQQTNGLVFFLEVGSELLEPPRTKMNNLVIFKTNTVTV